MRILYIAPYPPVRDGIGDYTAALAGEMHALGHTVGVLTPHSVAGAGDEVLGSLPRLPLALDQVQTRVAAFAPDVVHVQFAFAAYGARTAALLRLTRALSDTGVRVVMTMHEVTRDTESLRAPGRLLYRRLAVAGDRVLVHTPGALATLRGGVGASTAPASVVPHPPARLPPARVGASELRARHGLGDAPLLLAFGFIHVDKGLDDLVRALALLGDRVTPAPRLVVAGAVRRRRGVFRAFELRDRRHERHVRRLARELGVADRVTFAGYVPGGEVAGWLAAADAAVLPYVRIEESGVVSLAAAAGTPVLVSTAGGLHERIAAPAGTFPPRAPAALADALARFLVAPRGDRAPAEDSREAFVSATLALYDARREQHV